jgi:hypothetical protein
MTSNPSARQRKKAKQWTIYHADHGIDPRQIAYIKKFLLKSAPQGFFIKQWRFPRSQGLGTVLNAMWGPASGDRAVPESQVHYKPRGDRPWADRMIDRPPRPVNYGQALGIRDGDSFTLFTVYGGPLAPLNPADPDNQDVAGAKKFWKNHALSSHQWEAGQNPAFTPRPGVKIEWSPDPRRTLPAFIYLLDRGRLIGGLSVGGAPRGGGPLYEGAKVAGSVAKSGWGPLLYDTAALLSSSLDLPLVADTDTSPQAQKVWQGYLDRADVEVSPRSHRLPPSPVGWGVKIAPESFKERWGVTPDRWMSDIITSEDRLRDLMEEHKRLYFQQGGHP